MTIFSVECISKEDLQDNVQYERCPAVTVSWLYFIMVDIGIRMMLL